MSELLLEMLRYIDTCHSHTSRPVATRLGPADFRSTHFAVLRSSRVPPSHSSAADSATAADIREPSLVWFEPVVHCVTFELAFTQSASDFTRSGRILSLGGSMLQPLMRRHVDILPPSTIPEEKWASRRLSDKNRVTARRERQTKAPVLATRPSGQEFHEAVRKSFFVGARALCSRAFQINCQPR